MLSTEENQQFVYENNLVKEELIANLADWVDPDDVRLYQGGSEDALYARGDDPYHPKNAPFDTRDEIRLVAGWNDDGLWERVGRHLTIYGDARVNVNTAMEPVLKGLLLSMSTSSSEQAVEDTVADLVRLRGAPLDEGGLYFQTPEQFVSTIKGETGVDIHALPIRDDIDPKTLIRTDSDIFRVTSVGEVGDARVEIHVIFDFSEDKTGRVLFWKIR
ncbi:MAG: type II secretion system protein GspK [Myxococcota bacterium]